MKRKCASVPSSLGLDPRCKHSTNLWSDSENTCPPFLKKSSSSACPSYDGDPEAYGYIRVNSDSEFDEEIEDVSCWEPDKESLEEESAMQEKEVQSEESNDLHLHIQMMDNRELGESCLKRESIRYDFNNFITEKKTERYVDFGQAEAEILKFKKSLQTKVMEKLLLKDYQEVLEGKRHSDVEDTSRKDELFAFKLEPPPENIEIPKNRQIEVIIDLITS